MILFPTTLIEWLEICILATALYTFSAWLVKDRHAYLIGWLYGYLALCFVAYVLPLPLILSLIPLATPALGVMWILFHQHTLQKNVVPYKRNLKKSSPITAWAETLFRNALNIPNPSHSVTFVIERTDALETCIDAPFYLQAAANKELLDILLHTNVYCTQSMLWLTAHGIIVSSNAQWKVPTHIQKNTPKDTYTLEDLSYLYTSKTDAIVCIVNQKKRTATLIKEGESYEDVTIHRACEFIYKYTRTPSHVSHTKKVVYDANIAHKAKEHTT